MKVISKNTALSILLYCCVLPQAFAQVTVNFFLNEAESGAIGSIQFTDDTGPVTCSTMGALCTGTFTEGQTYTITATPGSGSAFGAWNASNANAVPGGVCHQETTLNCTFNASDIATGSISTTTDTISALFVTDTYPSVAPVSSDNTYNLTPGTTKTYYTFSVDDPLATFSVAVPPELGSVEFDPNGRAAFTYYNEAGLFESTSFQWLATNGAGSNSYTATLNVNDVDSDSDGVVDSGDLCPATPSIYAAQVNTEGCPPINFSLNLVSQPANTPLAISYGIGASSGNLYCDGTGACSAIGTLYQNQRLTLSARDLSEQFVLGQWVGLTCDEGTNTDEQCTFRVPEPVNGDVVITVEIEDNPDHQNLAPIGGSTVLSTVAGQSQTGYVFATDLESDALTYSLSQSSFPLGSLSVDVAGNLVFNPADSVSTGLVQSSVIISDGVLSVEVPLVVVVNSADVVEPSTVETAQVSASADVFGALALQLPSYTSNTGGSLTYSILSSETNVSIQPIDSTTGLFQVQADPGFVGTVNFVYTVTDSNGPIVADVGQIAIYENFPTDTPLSLCPSFARALPLSSSGSPQCVLPQRITENVTLTSDTLWVLDSRVVVGNGDGLIGVPTLVFDQQLGDSVPLLNVTMTIESGTHIVGAFEDAALIISRGSQLLAVGTAQSPIVFSSYDVGMDGLGEWGGLELQGRGLHRECPVSGTCNEVDGSQDGYIGGFDDLDNSGILQYVVIAEAGAGSMSGVDPSAAFTLSTVGSTTVLDHIHIMGSDGRGLAVVGGAPYFSHFLIEDTRYSGIAFSQGARGVSQFVFVDTGAQTIAPSILSELNSTIKATELYTEPTLANITVISDSAVKSIIETRYRGALHLYGSVVTVEDANSGADTCISIDRNMRGLVGSTGASSSKLTWTRSVFKCSYIDAGIEAGLDDGSTVYDYVIENANVPLTIDRAFTNSPALLGGTNSYTDTMFASITIDSSFLSDTVYFGAVDPVQGANWWSAWAATTDQDGDGVVDSQDAFPFDATETLDSDGDGVGDNSDAFPFDDNETLDSDGDGVGDNADAFPNDSTETLDSDGDGVGDNADPAPLDNTIPGDLDSDGILGHLDADDDGDGLPDYFEDRYVDLDSQDTRDALSDADGDGFSNLQEFNANTDLTSSLSVPDQEALRRTHLFAPYTTVDGCCTGFGEIFGADGDVLVAVGNDNELFIFGDQGNGLEYDQSIQTSYGTVSAIAVSGSAFAVGFDRYIDANGDVIGAVAVYRQISGVWSFEELVLSPAPTDGERFGEALAFDGDRLLIGAPRAGYAGFSTPSYGAAYLYEYSGSTWVLNQSFSALNISEYRAQSLGRSLALSGNHVVLGAYSVRDLSGVTRYRVFAYDSVDGVNWPTTPTQAVFTYSELSYAGGFGSSIAVENNTMVVGADYPDGRAYLYQFDTGTWYLTNSIQRSDFSDSTPYFGSSVSLEEGLLAVGAPFDGKGKVYLYTVGYYSATEIGVYQNEWIDEIEAFGANVVMAGQRLLVSSSYLGLGELGAGPSYLSRLDSYNWDVDNDSVADPYDAFVNDPSVSFDTDKDGLPDDWNIGYSFSEIDSTLIVDDDDDNDGVLDIDDAFPLDPYENTDSDGDGVGSYMDFDDNDAAIGVLDRYTAFYGDGATLPSLQSINPEWAVCVEDDYTIPVDSSQPNLTVKDITSIYCNNTLTTLDGVDRFPALQTLSARGGAISDLSPLTGLSRLRRLVLSDNLIEDLGPLQATHKPDLYSLNLTMNQLNVNEASNLQVIAGFKPLEYLFLGYNLLTTVEPLAGLDKLLGLDLYYNDLGNAGITYQGSEPRWPLLEYLYLDNTGLTDLSAIADLADRPLYELGISNFDYFVEAYGDSPEDYPALYRNELSDQSVLADFSSLETLYLDGLPVSDLSPLVQLPVLADLSCGGCNVTDLTSIGEMNALIWLSLSDNRIVDLSPLANLSELDSLDVSNYSRIGQNRVRDLSPLSGLPNLDSLQARDNGITNLGSLTQNGIPPIYSLDLSLNPLGNLDGVQDFYDLSYLTIEQAGVKDLTPLASVPTLYSVKASNIKPGTNDHPQNEITDLSPLSNLAYLDTLEVNRNYIGSLAPLKDLSLWKLSVAGNRLESIDELAGGILVSSVAYLNLNGNRLTSLDVLAEASSLSALRAAKNQVVDIDFLEAAAFVESNTNLSYLDVEGNHISSAPSGSSLSALSGPDGAVNLAGNRISLVSNIFTTMDTGALMLVGNPVDCDDAYTLAQNRPDLTTGLPATPSEIALVCVGDVDGDGVSDRFDDFPDDPMFSEDSDGDGLADDFTSSWSGATTALIDSDDDGDGVADIDDAFPLDSAEWSDIDADGIGDNSDPSPSGGSNAYPLLGDVIANFTDPGFASCVQSEFGLATPLDQIRSLDCSESGVGVLHLTGVSQLVNLRSISIYRADDVVIDLSGLSDNRRLSRLAVIGVVSDLSVIALLPALEELELVMTVPGPLDISPIGGAVTLNSLYLQGVQVNNADLSVLNSKPKLKALSLIANGISDLTALSLGPNLKALNLSHNPISDITTSDPFANLDGLEVLAMDGVLVTNWGSASVPGDGLNCCSALQSLSLSDTDLSSMDPTLLSSKVDLVYLNIDGSGFAGASGLSSLNALESLNINSLGLNDISFVASLTSLQYLSASGNSISSLPNLSGLSQLQTLLLADNHLTAISDVGVLGDGQTSLPQSLKFIVLTDNQLSDISGFTDILQSSRDPQLSYLFLRGNALTNVAALQGFQGRIIDLSGNSISSVVVAIAEMESGLILISGNPISCGEIDSLLAAAPPEITILFASQCAAAQVN